MTHKEFKTYEPRQEHFVIPADAMGFQTCNIFLEPKDPQDCPDDNEESLLPIMGDTTLNACRGFVSKKNTMDDESQVPIEGAKIVFTCSHSGTVFATTSKSDGNYEISLPAGKYKASVSHKEYKNYEHIGLCVVTGESTGMPTFNFFLEPSR